MNIAFIAGYPTQSRPNMAPFVKQFVWAMARQGHTCSVINPAIIFDLRYGPLPPRLMTEDIGGGRQVNVYHPRSISFSSRNLGWTHTGRWTQWAMNRAALRAIEQLPARPDVIYGHFLYSSGYAAVAAGKRMGIPSVVGVGEGVFWTVKPFGFPRAKRDFTFATGFLAVASHIRDGLIEQIGVPPEKIIVEPNSVDLTRFCPSNRVQARKEIGVSPNKFIITFVGNFDDLKGGV